MIISVAKISLCKNATGYSRASKVGLNATHRLAISYAKIHQIMVNSKLLNLFYNYRDVIYYFFFAD